MDENLTPIERLDFVLKYFIEMNEPPFKRAGEIKEALGYERTKEMYEIFHKLEKDGYISTDILPTSGVNTTVFGSTFDGRLFYLTGGYATKFLNDELDAEQQMLELERLRNVDAQSVRNQIRLNSLTSWLVVGTIAASLVAALLLAWQVWIFYHPEPIPVDVKLKKRVNYSHVYFSV